MTICKVAYQFGGSLPLNDMRNAEFTGRQAPFPADPVERLVEVE
jgi:hypothetical protein